jgi:hypothetical protein
MSKLELGQRVTFSHPLHRKYENGKKFWTDNPFPALIDLYPSHRASREVPRDGVIVGKRTISNGDLLDWEEGSYGSIERFTAYLVAFNLHRKPVYVMPERIKAVTP